jgi:hypothetical protein
MMTMLGTKDVAMAATAVAPAEATAAAATSTRLLEKILRLVCQLPARDAKLGNPEKRVEFVGFVR